MIPIACQELLIGFNDVGFCFEGLVFGSGLSVELFSEKGGVEGPGKKRFGFEKISSG